VYSYGWLVLIGAGGGAYFFAKRSINADREARHAKEMERHALQRRFEDSEYVKQHSKSPAVENGGAANKDNAAEPSREANLDPAPTRHEPETESQRVVEKSKYEASEVWRSKKGDRLR
jgi:hypothetical protein